MSFNNEQTRENTVYTNGIITSDGTSDTINKHTQRRPLTVIKSLGQCPIGCGNLALKSQNDMVEFTMKIMKQRRSGKKYICVSSNSLEKLPGKKKKK